MHRPGMLSIWFFIGVLLLAYGVLIFGASVYEWVSPPVVQTVKLAELHAGVWWGALLVILGAVYIAKFRPGRNN